MCNVLLWPTHVTQSHFWESEMEQEGYHEEKHSVEWPEALPGSLSMQTRLLPWARRTFHFFLIPPPFPSSLLLCFFFFLKLHLFWKQHKRKEGENLRRKKMKSILSMPETSGFIFEAWKKKEIARRQNSYVLIYFIIRRAVACSGAVQVLRQ